MLDNHTKLLYNQQAGYAKWNDYGVIMSRYLCKKENAYTQLLDTGENDELTRDTPIFACKFALQPTNEHYLALANEDGKLAIHNVQDNSRYGAQIHHNAIFDLAWMFDQMKLVTAGGDHAARLIDIGNGEVREETVFYGHTRSVKTVTFKKGDSSVFATGGRDGQIILWDTRMVQSSLIGKPDHAIQNSHMSRNYTPSKRKKWTPTTSGVKSVTGLVFQDDNTLISCGAGDGVIKAWDLRRHYNVYKNNPTPKFVIPYSGNTSKNGFSSLVVNEEGTKLYANCLDNCIYCYNVSTYCTEPLMIYNGHQNSSFYIKSCLSKDGEYLISGSSDENAYIWSTKRSNPMVKLVGHNAEVTCVAWCHLDNTLVTCSDDMTHKLWTVGNEEKPDDWAINGCGQAEVVPRFLRAPDKDPLKRLPVILEDTPKKLAVECGRCNSLINSKGSCENCRTNRKRRNSEELHSENKTTVSEFGPKRLFTGQAMQSNQLLATSLDEETETKVADEIKECNSPTTSSYQDLDYAPPSPTINLPNFVKDGLAPHINYSPPKKRNQDWLTRLRIERKFKREMQEKAMENCPSPKIPRVDTTPSRRTSSTKSPLLRFFKVTNIKPDGLCPSKVHSCDNYISSPSH